MGIGKASGSLGNITYRLVNGETVASQKISKGTQKLGTLSQVNRRIRIANLSAAYRALNNVNGGAGMYQSFPFRDRRQSNWNAFFRRNIGPYGNVYLTREQAAMGTLIPAPFIVSEGSMGSLQPTLDTIEAGKPMIKNNGTFVFTALPGATATSTVADLSTAFINQMGCQEGDTITVFGFNATSSPDGSLVSTNVRHFQFVVNTSDDENLLTDIGMSLQTESSETYPGITLMGLHGAAMVIGRNTGAGYDVTTSQFKLTDAGMQMWNGHNTDSVRLEAAASYGYKQDPYLQNGNPL